MNKIKVDYKKHWGKDGTCYSQTITLKKDFLKYINKQIDNYFNSSVEVREIIADNSGISTYYDCYLDKINVEEKYNYLTLTQLLFIEYYLDINNYDTRRVKYRNTIIKVV
jgi:hypothetical protein